ncbi:NTP_transferase domain-containing protein [Meloidogyne graminicola]|uniref:Translation initiation factor eIF2B subunit gamma n=1 Tax=Meloidogyne graminicola TaxID=189291 RepID=A0A8T0A4P5_9BILA|nr:NTP_transferase domain-containing protein [Meloidogyne graminicola]
MSINDKYVVFVLSGGKGNRMPSITDHIPKPFLPVTNIPLFWFPLNFLQRNGFKECFLVVQKTKIDVINKIISNGSLPSLDDFKINLISFNDEECSDEFGTADVLRQNLDKLNKKNVLIVSGDLITDLSIEGMLGFHERMDSMLTCFLSDSPLGGAVPGTTERPKKYRDFVMLSAETNQLLYLVDEEDFGENEKFPANLFRSSPNIQSFSKYKDLHLYAIKRDALNLLGTSKSNKYSSLKADFIPDLIYGQFSVSKRRFLGLDEQNKYKCFGYFGNKNECCFLAQCNHLGAYFEANKNIKKYLTKLDNNLDSKFLGKQTNQNQSENWIAENTKFGTKVQIKRSVIGEGCIIGDNVKIDNCVLMSNISINSGSTLKNSIILNNCQIGEQTNLTMCIVSPEQKIPKKAKFNCVTICEEKEMNFCE